MNPGKKNAPLLVQPEKTVPEPLLAFAKWLLDHPQVVEVWSMASDLPEISTPEVAVTLDSGTWFLCRVQVPPMADDHIIISYVPQV